MDIPDRSDFDPDASLRGQLAEAVAHEAAFGGWSDTAMRAAARQIGAPEGEAERLFPGGPVAVLAWLSERADLRTVEAMEAAGASGLKIRERIKMAVRARIEQTVGGRESVRRGLATLALPSNAALGLKLLYRTVDAIWYAAGDTSTDFNFYTKRATLAGVYSSTLFYWLNDRSEGSEATWGFLDRRIENVMRFEKWKAGLGSWRGPKGWAARGPSSRHR
ncbi:MAG: COQ9 family protein [Enhydrobacter sp.]|nr:COQ9 family protein [Enhydrobacter sp.]